MLFACYDEMLGFYVDLWPFISSFGVKNSCELFNFKNKLVVNKKLCTRLWFLCWK